MLLKDKIKKEKRNLKEKCRCCGEMANYFSSAIIMGIKNIDYFLCPICGFLQTEFPTWLDKAYKEAINDSDIGLLKRNLEFSTVVEDVIKIYFNKDQNFLDWGGGYGLLAGLMREKGYNFYLYEPYAPNLFAKNYVYENEKIELITCFEVFEHFLKPYNEFEKIFSISKNILFSTLLLPPDIPDPLKWPVSWSYYGLEHGQHISFYQLKTLQKIAQDRGLNLYTDGCTLHLITEKNINTNYFPLFSDIKKTNWSYTKIGPGSRQSYPRRFKTGFIEKYMKGKILDIGYKGYEKDVLPVVDWAIGVDVDYPGYDGKKLPFDDNSVDCVYASHVLEHIDDYKTAIREWFRVLKTGGYMILSVPHMYLYEKRKHLPSMWNADHKRFYTPSKLLKEIEESLFINTYRIRHLIDDDEGYDYSITPEFHCGGSYQIEIVIEKIKKPDWDLIDGYEFRKDQTNINTYYFIRSSEIFLNNIDKATEYIMKGEKNDYFFITILTSIDKIIKDGNILKHHLTLINDNDLNLMEKIRFDIINYTIKSAVSIDFLKDLNYIKKKINKIKKSLEE